jgi:drug/metabolite transporter (DMT)-like permease
MPWAPRSLKASRILRRSRAAAAISTSYVLLVVVLSRIFLGESLSWLKVVGILLTVAGVALLSWEQE